MVCNSRFLILPHVKVPHLASHVLELALRRLQEDFRQRYGYEPLLVETFVEQERFAGTCYRAENFIEVAARKGGDGRTAHTGVRVSFCANRPASGCAPGKSPVGAARCAGTGATGLGGRGTRRCMFAGIQELHVPWRKSSPARVARLAVCFAPVTLKAPKIKSRYGPLTL